MANSWRHFVTESLQLQNLRFGRVSVKMTSEVESLFPEVFPHKKLGLDAIFRFVIE